MSDSVIITGTVIRVTEPKSYGDKGFQKAECVIETDDPKFPQKIPIDATGKKAMLFQDAGVKPGDRITLHCNLQGREWNDRYFLSLAAWKGEFNDSQATTPSQRRDDQSDDRPPIPDDSQCPADDCGDDIPF